MGLHPNEAIINELLAEFRIKFGCEGSEFAMACELYDLALLVQEQERRIKEFEADRHLSFYREPPKRSE